MDPSTLLFNVHDYVCEDTPQEDDDDVPTYVIKMFGKMEDGRSVSVSVTGFPPHFYISLPCEFKDKQMSELKELVVRKLASTGCQGGFKTCKYMRRKDYWGFQNQAEQHFLQLIFHNHASMRKAAYVFGKTIRLPSVGRVHNYRLYESNVEPFIRFFHKQGIRPCGWVRVANARPNKHEYRTSCDIDVAAKWTDVEGVAMNRMAPFKLAAFDIECTSFDGEFPIAIRDIANSPLRSEADFVERVESWCTNVVRSIVEDGAATAEAVEDAFFARIADGRVRFKGAPPAKGAIRGAIGEASIKADDAAARAVAKRILSKVQGLEGDPIIMVGLTVSTYGDKSDALEKHIYIAGPCSDIPGAHVHVYPDERSMLMGFSADLRRIDPDVLLGYNVFGFDMEYMNARGVELGCDREWRKLGRLIDRSSPFEKRMCSSSAIGDNFLRLLRIDGRPCIDIMKVVQRDHKLDSFKLDNVAEHFLGDKKHDVSPKDIFRMWGGSDDDRKTVAEYCIQDCALLNRLCKKLEIFTNTAAMANVCYVPLIWILVRGQGVKIFSLILRQCKEDGFLVPVVKYAGKVEGEEDGYEGAMVLTPTPGIYLDHAIAVLDYASLYPSSMISENISHDTIVLDDKYRELPGVEYIDIDADGKTCRFAQQPVGVLPRILKGLLDERKKTRKKIGWKRVSFKDGRSIAGMVARKDGAVVVTNDDGATVIAPEDVAAEGDAFDDFEKAVLDGVQQALKVTANSLYGQVGAKTSPVYMKDLAACTTATGRKMIIMAKEFVEKSYAEAEVIYGDSVAEYVPLIIRAGGVVDVVRIDDLAARFGAAWRSSIGSGKESSELTGVEVWSDSGWTPVQRVIRHDLMPGKRMVRVFTGQSIVDVTTDHSLILANGTPISPRMLKAGDALLHAPAPALPKVQAGDEDEFYASLCDMDPITADIINTSVNARKAILGARFRNRVFVTDDARDASALYLIAASLGHMVSVDWTAEGYSLTLTQAVYAMATPVVRQLMVVPYEGKVYDLTTVSSHFHAGVGTMIVHNTDSIFVKVPAPSGGAGDLISSAIAFGKRASAEFKGMLKAPHDLEFDKVFGPFIIFSKKRYAGNMYEDSAEKFKFKSMGICLRRRDSAAIVKTIYGGVLDIVLNKRDIDGAASFLVGSLTRLVSGGFPMDELVITKSLRGSYKDPSRIAHKVLADRIGERDPGNKPQSSDRVAYVYVKSENKKALQGERIETPEFIVSQGLSPDFNFYVTNQIANPITQLFGIVVEQLPGYDRAPDYWARIRAKLEEDGLSGDKLNDKVQALREGDAHRLLIDPVLSSIGEKTKRRRELLKS
jgi:DNA polymerase elongation subunit (family B)